MIIFEEFLNCVDPTLKEASDGLDQVAGRLPSELFRRAPNLPVGGFCTPVPVVAESPIEIEISLRIEFVP